MGNAFGAGVGAVGGGEGIVDEDVGEAGQGRGEGCVVGFLASVEARVFEDQDVATGELLDGLIGHGADAVFGEGNRLVENFGEGGGHRAEGKGRVGFAFGAVEMAADDDFGAFVREFADGGGEALDAGEVGDFAVLDRDVEVGADQHAQAGDGDVVEGLGCHLEGPEQGSGVGHAVGKAPFVVVPAHDAGQRAVHHCGLGGVEGAGIGDVVEVGTDEFGRGIVEDAL